MQAIGNKVHKTLFGCPGVTVNEHLTPLLVLQAVQLVTILLQTRLVMSAVTTRVSCELPLCSMEARLLTLCQSNSKPCARPYPHSTCKRSLYHLHVPPLLLPISLMHLPRLLLLDAGRCLNILNGAIMITACFNPPLLVLCVHRHLSFRIRCMCTYTSPYKSLTGLTIIHPTAFVPVPFLQRKLEVLYNIHTQRQCAGSYAQET